MKFGIFYELQLPRPWEADGERRVLEREIELAEIDTTPFRDRYGQNSVQVAKPFAAAGSD